MVTLTYIDAYQVERTTTYPNLAACIPSFFRLCQPCLTLTQSYPLNTRGKAPYTGRVDGLYAF